MDENQSETININQSSNVDPISDNGTTVNVSSYNVDGTDYTNNTSTNSTQNDSGRTGLTTASLVLGILSLIPCCCWNWLGLIFGILAIIFSIVGRENAGEQGKKDAKVGLICGIIGVVLFVVIMIVMRVFVLRIIGLIVEFLRNNMDKINIEEINESIDFNGIMESLQESIPN